MKRPKCEASNCYLRDLEGYFAVAKGADFLNLHGECPF